jgi:hypothetical protein
MSQPVWKYLGAICSMSHECVGIETSAYSGGSGPGSATFPASNDAIFVPLYLSQATLVKRLFSSNGSAVSGNIDVGIYTENGARITSSGSTAQSGTSTLQFFDITDIVLGPGRYYLAVAMDNTTGTLFRVNPTLLHVIKTGVVKQASAFALPASATLVTATASYIPMIGIEIVRAL